MKSATALLFAVAASPQSNRFVTAATFLNINIKN